MIGLRIRAREAQDRLAEATRPHLAALKGYSKQRHRQEAALFIRWALDLGLTNSSWSWPVRQLVRARVQLAWSVICVKDGLRPGAYSTRRREALSTVWNTRLYTDDGLSLSPVSVTSRSARLFVSGVAGGEDRAATAALLPILRAEFETLAMRMQPRLRPRPNWVKVT